MYEIFAKLLKENNVKVSEVSRATGIASSTFSDWKNGRYTPKQDKLQTIAEYFDVTVDYLMNGTEAEGYYLNDETKEMAQAIFDDKELKALFSVARDASPEDLKLAHDMLKRMKSNEESNDND